ncbi:MAG: hypothetical protein MSA37_07980 [Prevotella sp.]|nr:hypothetical protein [Prevotella sp.]
MENRNIFYCIVLSQQQEEFLDSAKSGVNRYRFINFLARNAVMEQTACKVKGYTVSLQVGQVAFAEGELARLFGCERKTIQRLVESMRALQLVSTNSTNRATVFTLLYLSGWLIEGNMVRNPYYHRPLAKTRQENVVSVPSGMNVTLPNNSTSSLCSEEIDTMDNVGKSEWKSNSHAHILFDWMDHATGKSWKLDKKAMSDLQTLAAETLNMERGKSKEETGREHLERNDFILAKQKEETAQVLADKKKAEIEKHEAQMQVRAANREKGRLDSEIEKRRLHLMSNKRMQTDCLSTHFKPKYLSCPKATWSLAVGTLVWRAVIRLTWSGVTVYFGYSQKCSIRSRNFSVRLSMPSYPLQLPTDKEDTETSFATRKQQQSRRP